MSIFNRIIAYLSANRARIQRLSKEGGWIVFGQVAMVVGSLLLVRVMTEYLTPVQYGELALGLTVALLVNQVVMGGVVNGIGRYYSIAYEKQDLGGYLNASYRLIGYSVLAVIGIGIALMSGLSWLGYDQWLGLAIATIVFAVLRGCNSALSGIQNAARQRAIVAFHKGMEPWLKIGLVLAALIWLGTSSTAVVVGYIGAMSLVTLSQLLFLRRTIPPARSCVQKKHQDWVRLIWTFSWPFSTWGVFTWMQMASGRWALETFASTGDVGQYAVLYQLGYAPITLFTGMAATFLAPILYQRIGDAMDTKRNAQAHDLSWLITKAALLVTTISFLATLTLHETLFGILVSMDYRMSSQLLPWLVLAGGLFAAAQMLALKLMSEMRTRLLVIIKVVTALLGIGLNIVGAVIAGTEGVVGALVAFSCSYFLWMLYSARKTVNH